MPTDSKSRSRSAGKKTSAPPIVAVLTGDLVDSSRLPTSELQRLPAVLRDITRAARKIWGAPLAPLDIEVFRGDGWQWLLTSPERALRASLYVRAALRSAFPEHDVVTRIAIGFGPVTAMPATRVSQGLGPAFTVSGHALETMPKHTSLAMARADPVSPAPALETPLLDLISALAHGWTAAQARAITGTIAGLTQAGIAEQWEPSIDRTAVVRHVERASWAPIQAAVDTWEAVTDFGHVRHT